MTLSSSIGSDGYEHVACQDQLVIFQVVRSGGYFPVAHMVCHVLKLSPGLICSTLSNQRRSVGQIVKARGKTSGTAERCHFVNPSRGQLYRYPAATLSTSSN